VLVSQRSERFDRVCMFHISNNIEMI